MNQKKKGNAGEHAFAHFLESHGIKAFRNSMSGGSIWKGDIGNNLGLCIEVKTVKKINIRKAWAQVNQDSSKSKAEPILVIHLDGMPPGEWLVVQHSADWVERLKSHQTQDSGVSSLVVPETHKELRYSLERLKQAVSKVQKLL